jgi:hypothetical protein
MPLSDAIKGKVRKPPMIWVYGVPAVGKSTLAAQLGNPYFIDAEGGLDEIGPTRQSVDSFAATMSVLRDLATEKHDYNTVAVDSTSEIERFIWARVANENGVENVADINHGRGYFKTLDPWKEFVKALRFLRDEKNMAVLLIGHSTVERVEPPDNEAYDRYAPRLYKTASALLQESCDAILFAGYKVLTKTKEGDFGKKTGKALDHAPRILRTEERPYCLAKNRYQWPYEVPLTMPFDWNTLLKHESKTKEN